MTFLDTRTAGRQLHLDACRGFTMLLVVYTHLIHYLNDGSTALNQYFILFRMPLFFFVSGYLAYSASYDMAKLRRRSLNRLLRQLYPTLILWAVYCWLVRPYSLEFGVFSWRAAPLVQFKQGYWFTLVAVELFFITAPMLYLFSRLRVSRLTAAGLTVLLIIALLIHNTHAPGVERPELLWYVNRLSSWTMLTCYAPYFFAGIVCKIFSDEFNRLAAHWLTPLVAFAAYMACAHLVGRSAFVMREWINPADTRYMYCGVFGIVLVYSAFMQLCRLRGRNVRMALERLALVGRHTLEIYLLHYFVLYAGRHWLRSGQLASCLDRWYEFPVLLSVAICCVGIILTLVEAARRIRLYPILFPSSR